MIHRQPVPRGTSVSAATPARAPVPTPAAAAPIRSTAKIAKRSNAVGHDIEIAARLTVHLARSTALLVPRLAATAMHLMRIEGCKSLGFTCASDFARERLDRSSSWLRQQARLGRACEEMPALERAITGADGGKAIGRVAAYEVCRVAQPETVDAWIHCARSSTIRELQKAIRLEQSKQPSSVAAAQVPQPLRTLAVQVPAFLAGALLDIERVFRATNPGSRRCDLIEALTAEHASGDEAGMLDVPERRESTDVARHIARRVAKQNAEKRVSQHPGQLENSAERKPFTPQDAGVLDGPIDGFDEQTTNRELVQARWTLHRVQMFVALLGDMEANADAEQLAQSMCNILALEHEIKLRIDHLLLWLDHRRAWSLLGHADAAGFGLAVLEESPSTTRNRLRLARALEKSAALRHGAESGRISHQRLVRLAQLAQQRNLLEGNHEHTLREWVDHASRIRIKRIDEEFEALERKRWAALESASASDSAALSTPPPPLPLTDAEWQASLRLVPGDARRHLLMGALQALANGAPANVCHRFTATVDIIRDLRHSLNRVNVRLARLAAEECAPADESRLFPSIRLAARYLERRIPIPEWVCLLSLLEEFTEEYDNPRNMPRRPTDDIAARDGWRCTAPGCTSREIEVHHIVYRSRGGSDDPSNLTCLCPFHHRMGEHGGLLKLTGTAPLDLRWDFGNQVYQNERLIEEFGRRCSGEAV